MSTPRPEQTPPRPSSGNQFQPRPAASYADLVAGQQSAPALQSNAGGDQRGGSGFQGWKPTRSPWPGYVGLVMVIIALLIMMSVIGSMFEAAIPLVVSQIKHGADPSMSPAMLHLVLNAFNQAAPDGAMLLNVAWWIGVVGAFLGLVGAVIGRGRGAGAVAVVIGILAPVVLGVYFAFTIDPMITP